MSQAEVMHYLSKHRKKWYSSNDIAKGLDAPIINVMTNLKKLRKFNFVEYKHPLSPSMNYLYKYKKN